VVARVPALTTHAGIERFSVANPGERIGGEADGAGSKVTPTGPVRANFATTHICRGAAALMRGEPVHKLIDDQIVAYEAVLVMVRHAQKDNATKPSLW